MTDFAARAREIAPCNCSAERTGQTMHEQSCPAPYRPAIAAALRECDKAAREECAGIAHVLPWPKPFVSAALVWGDACLAVEKAILASIPKGQGER